MDRRAHVREHLPRWRNGAVRRAPVSGVDGGFLYAEGASQPSTVLVVMTLDGPAISRSDLSAHVEPRLDLVPWTREVLVPVPLGLGHPTPGDDGAFDLGYHVREELLPAPGGPAELDVLVASLAARRLDRRHPLWRLVLVHGLAGGRQAVILLVHHALVDGAALRRSLELLFGPLPAGDAGTRREPCRAGASLLLGAVVALLRGLAGLPRLVVDTARALRGIDRRRASATVAVPAGDDTPPCILNQAFDDRRVTARATIGADRFTAARAATGTSFTDILLSGVGGALRQVLAPAGLLPARSLTASIPVSLDPPDAPPRTSGNHVTTVVTTRGTDDPDPARRAGLVSAVTSESLAQLRAGDPSLPARWLELAVPALAEPAMRHWARRRRARPERADFSVLVSSVRGPATELRIGPARVTAVHQSGPTFDGAGVNVTATTMGDSVHLAVLAHPDALPDPAGLLSALVDELDQMAGQRVTGAG